MLYSAWLKKWLLQKEQLVKASTYAAYSNIAVNHLLPKFGNYDLSCITEELIQNYVFELLQHGKLDGTGGMNERSAKDIIVVLKNTLKDAIRAKHIPLTIFEIRFPKTQRTHNIYILPQAVQQRLCQAVYLDFNRRNAGILLSLYTGMRIGEICALRWSDINLEERLISVNHTLQRVYRKNLDGHGQSKLLLTSPKSKTSVRKIPISQILLPILRKLYIDSPDAYFISGNEKCVEVRTFRTCFENFLRKNDIERFNFHALRHTFATRCIEAGADCKTVSELLGHATVNMTLNLYVHPQMEQKRKCVDLLCEP